MFSIYLIFSIFMGPVWVSQFCHGAIPGDPPRYLQVIQIIFTNLNFRAIYLGMISLSKPMDSRVRENSEVVLWLVVEVSL